LAQEPADFTGAVQELDGDHDQSVAAVQELRAGGEAAAVAIRDVWPTLSRKAQRRALAALASLAHEHRPAAQCLYQAAHSVDEQIREAALAALQRAGPAGWEALIALLADPDVGDRAAVLLARTEPDAAIAALLDALTAEGGERRSVLRTALATAAQRAEQSAEPTLRAWLETGPPVRAVANASLALASIGEYGSVVASFIEYAAPRSDDFPTTWRLLRSAKAAGPSEPIDRWIQTHLQTPKEWMLRQAAVDALAARGQRTKTRVALDDPYPRVRVHAARVLSRDSDSMTERATLAKKDHWPMVRAEAVMSLRSEPLATPIIVAAVDDPMSEVRAAAIGVLAGATHEDGWDRIYAHLQNRNEWPQVTAAAIKYVTAHCRIEAVDALVAVARRAASPNALTDDINNAARAIGALRVLDTPQAKAALGELSGLAEVSPTLKMALEEPVPRRRRCVPLSP
jgi:HEAT repeat protein